MTEEVFYKVDSKHDVPSGWGKWQILAPQLAVGDSVLLKTYNEATCLAKVMRKHGFKSVKRCTNVGVRLWRVD